MTNRSKTNPGYIVVDLDFDSCSSTYFFAQLLQDDFVVMRKDDPSMTGEYFHYLLALTRFCSGEGGGRGEEVVEGCDELAGYTRTLAVICRLVSLSHGEEVLKVSSWERARQLDRQRRTRMN